ncbi:exonuclease domain-containing protein [Clostridium pasteurianum]|uniref:3'-5' exonuclease n=1 Tax=Clostridium pasteurianum TaxID=1501 RepID=UPI002260AAFA|nr:3'-5' exonuclease [Clostridium pasteurianum]UZW12884.1 exonuclease domain-containing protein [Clostridium pasteurianum]
MNVNCYYDIQYNEKNKKVSLKIVIENTMNNIIYKSNRAFKITNKKRLNTYGLNILFDTLEELEVNKIISLNDNVTIYTDNLKKVPVIPKYEMLNCNNVRTIENLKLRFKFHENWVFNINIETKELLEKTLNRKKDSKKGLISKKVVKHNKPNVIRKISDLMKNNSHDIIFFDIEMNCNDGKKVKTMWEAVSIGAVKVSANGEIHDTFYSLIKPSKQSILSDRCKEITGLSQNDIDGAVGLKGAMSNFSGWVGDKPTIFVSWGKEDIKVLKKDDKYNGFRLPIISRMRKKYIDFQKEFCHYYLNSKDMTSLIRALAMFNLNFEGAQHNALDDTINLVNIYINYKECISNDEEKVI